MYKQNIFINCYLFLLEQLQEIRKANLAALLCNVADGITHIQRQAFLLISEE